MHVQICSSVIPLLFMRAAARAGKMAVSVNPFSGDILFLLPLLCFPSGKMMVNRKLSLPVKSLGKNYSLRGRREKIARPPSTGGFYLYRLDQTETSLDTKHGKPSCVEIEFYVTSLKITLILERPENQSHHFSDDLYLNDARVPAETRLFSSTPTS